MNQVKKILAFLILSLTLGLVVSSGLEQGPKTIQASNPFQIDSQVGFQNNEIPGEAFGQSNNPKDVRLIVADVIKVILGFVAIVLIALLVWSGFEWMTAAGNEDKVKQAKARIKNSIIGLIIILAAYGITYFVIDQVIGATRHPWEW